MLISYKNGSVRLATCIVEYSILHPFNHANPDWVIDNTETENLFISENGRNEEAEMQDII